LTVLRASAAVDDIARITARRSGPESFIATSRCETDGAHPRFSRGAS
jgi:hypothetical protein